MDPFKPSHTQTHTGSRSETTQIICHNHASMGPNLLLRPTPALMVKKTSENFTFLCLIVFPLLAPVCVAAEWLWSLVAELLLVASCVDIVVASGDNGQLHKTSCSIC